MLIAMSSERLTNMCKTLLVKLIFQAFFRRYGYNLTRIVAATAPSKNIFADMFRPVAKASIASSV